MLTKPITSNKPRSVYMRAYRARRGEELSIKEAAYYAEYRKLNSEAISEQQYAYRAKSKERIAAYNHTRYIKNKSKKAAYDAVYRQTKKAEIAAYMQVWNTANKELRAEHGRNRKARVRGAEGKHTAKEVRAMFQAQGGQCVYCQKSLYDGFHADHIVPVSKGGTNWISNIQLLCPHCNISKHDLSPDEYAERQRSRSSMDRAPAF